MQNTSNRHPDFSKIPKILFWDTDFDEINWEEKYVSIIKRVFERGDDSARMELLKFYGSAKIEKALSVKSTRPMELYINL